MCPRLVLLWAGGAPLRGAGGHILHLGGTCCSESEVRAGTGVCNAAMRHDTQPMASSMGFMSIKPQKPVTGDPQGAATGRHGAGVFQPEPRAQNRCLQPLPCQGPQRASTMRMPCISLGIKPDECLQGSFGAAQFLSVLLGMCQPRGRW